MNRNQFEHLVDKAYRNIPEQFRNKIDNVVIKVEDYPSAEDKEKLRIRGEGLLLGLYRGTPRHLRSVWQGVRLPDEIVLYQKDIEKVCRNDREIEEKINEVLKHELGHYFGLSDDEIYELMGRD
ncbi:MAG TPA: metallopeptidase family protein [Thermodesulfobacteriota bacterium]|nr:metallopeptidase family protein [Thermodesulfobacteriota bacterium]